MRYSARLSGSKTAGPLARRLRDLTMPIALRRFARPEAHAWMYDHVIELPCTHGAGSAAASKADPRSLIGAGTVVTVALPWAVTALDVHPLCVHPQTYVEPSQIPGLR